MKPRKTKQVWICNSCFATAPRWTGRCPLCRAWDTMELERTEKPSEAEMFREIWNERAHKSELSGRDIGNDMLPEFFHHILTKGKYPHFKYNKDNIILLHPDEHFIIHHGTADDVIAYEKQYKCKFAKLTDIKAKLLKEYNKKD